MMTTTSYDFYPSQPMPQPHYHPEIYDQLSIIHDSDMFAPNVLMQPEILQHDTFSLWPPSDNDVIMNSHGHDTTTPEIQNVPSPCCPYQDEDHSRRGSTVSTSEFDSGRSLQSAVPPPPPPPSQRPALRSHSSSSSSSSSSTTTTSSSTKLNECSYCTRIFARRHDLERHSRVHTGIKPYVCPCCLKAFPRSDARRRHFRNETLCSDGPQILAWMKKNIRSTI